MTVDEKNAWDLFLETGEPMAYMWLKAAGEKRGG